MRSAFTGRTRRLPIRLLLAAGLRFLLAACGSSTQLNPGYPVLTMSASNSGASSQATSSRWTTITLTGKERRDRVACAHGRLVDLVKLSDISELVSAFRCPTELTCPRPSCSTTFAGTPACSSTSRQGDHRHHRRSRGNTALGQVNVVVTFDPAKPLVVTLQQATPVHINFDLQAFNSINTSATTPAVTVQPYVAMNPASIDSTPLRARGSLVIAQNGYIVMNLRPFYNFSASLGAVVVTPTADAYYNVNGVVYTGAAGLAAMASLAPNHGGRRLRHAHRSHRPRLATPPPTPPSVPRRSTSAPARRTG